MQHAKIIPISRARQTAPTLFGVDRSRLRAARTEAEHRASEASRTRRPRLARQWLAIVDRLDDTLSQDEVA